MKHRTAGEVRARVERARDTETASRDDAPAEPQTLRIVGLGASAGGLEAFQQFLQAMPTDSGLALVLVQHLDPEHSSVLTELLQRCTAMPVVEAVDQMEVAPDHVYVIPPNRHMAILHGKLQLELPPARRGQRLPIDTFFRSLADDCGERAAGVVLSGTGSDGTLGLAAIAAAGGLCLVQDPASAKYDSMPASAVAASPAAQALAPAHMPEALLRHASAGSAGGRRPPAEPQPVTDVASLNRVLLLLRSATGHDYALYKRSTLVRRMQRRMAAHGIDEVAVYARLLEQDAAELRSLDKEMLINVSGFFRDPEAFAALESDVLPALLADRPEGATLRVWVAACASGEEAYSLAMLLHEAMDQAGRAFKLQLYATDLDEEAIAVARAGLYPRRIAEQVSAERLARFFVEEEGGFRIRKSVRDQIVFAVQNVIKDPPFTRLDLLSCRNLLIYLEPALQDRLLPVLHYALTPGAVLMLSPSESVGQHADLFAPIDRKHKLYRALLVSTASRAAGRYAATWATHRGEPAATEGVQRLKKTEPSSLAELARTALLHSFAPASVLIDAEGTVLYVHGDTGAWLRPAPGEASLNIVEMAREGLQAPLRAAILGAAAAGLGTLNRELSVEAAGLARTLLLSVRPLEPQPAGAAGSPALLLVSFRDAPPAAAASKPRRGSQGAAPAADPLRLEALQEELKLARATLQSVVEEHQAYSEELKSANEELQSTNEELQSTNEELETSREEQQSINEEMATVNNELQAKIDQLATAQNDLKNLLDNVNVGTIFLDDQLVIRRFTREAQRLYRLVATDLGRRLDHIRCDVDGDALIADAHAVLESLAPRQRELRSSDGTWYLARTQAYRTLDNVIQGVVLTFTDISQGKRLEGELREALDLSQAVVDTVREPLVVLDGELRIVSASRSFRSLLGDAEARLAGRPLSSLDSGAWDSPALRERLQSVLAQHGSFDDYLLEHPVPGGGPQHWLLNARLAVGAGSAQPMVLLAVQDAGPALPATPGKAA